MLKKRSIVCIIAIILFSVAAYAGAMLVLIDELEM